MAIFTISENLKVHGTITDQSGDVVKGAPTVEVSKNSAAAVGTRRTMNLIEGANITLTIVDDPGGDEIDVTIAAAGAGGNPALDVQLTVAEISLTSIASTDIINVTEAGRLQFIGGIVKSGDTPDGSPVVLIDVTIDGGTTRSWSVYNAGIIWSVTGVSGFRVDDVSTGSGNFDCFQIPLNNAYATSLQVALNVTTATTAAGTLFMTVIRGKEL